MSARVSGDSMAPGMMDGDEVRLRRVEPEDVRQGDVIAYERGGRLVLHALHFTLRLGRHRWLFLKGTANPVGDRPVSWEDVVGKVTSVFRDGVESPLAPVQASFFAGARAWWHLVEPSPRRLLARFNFVKGVFL